MRDELDEFLLWFVSQGPNLGKVPVMQAVTTLGHDGKGGNVMSGVWYRKGQFQVELLMIVGPWIIPEHTHPNIDSYQVLLGGQIRFSRHGEWLTPETYQVDINDDGTSPYRGQRIRVNHNDLHGGVVGPEGVMYFSVQHWLNGVEPHSVGLDWNGRTASQQQLDKLKFGNASFEKEKTEQMAVSSI
jgi:hypothetical protein